MSELPLPESNPPTRTPEQHAAVRRRSLPVALVANVLAMGALAVLFSRTVSVHAPPDVFAANISFCAILMGVGILFYARGTSGTGVARVLCVAATLLGLAGPALYAWQSVRWRLVMELTELQHAADIARAAEKYAGQHEGAYPKSPAELLSGNFVAQETLLSPFGGQGTQYLREMQQKGSSAIKMSIASDYTYVGGDLHLPLAPGTAAKIVVAYETEPVMRQHFAVGFADGTSRFLTLDDAGEVLKTCNEARAALGLPPLKEPESIERATAAQTQP
jgi:hypothetical protein